MKNLPKMASRLKNSVLRRLLEEVSDQALVPYHALQNVIEYLARSRARSASGLGADRSEATADPAFVTEDPAANGVPLRELKRSVTEVRITEEEAVPFVDTLISSGRRAPKNLQCEAATLDARVGPFYATASLLEWLRMSSEALDSLVGEGRVLQLQLQSADGYRLFPAFQFGQDAHPLPRLRDVLAELDPGQVDPWGDAVWLNEPAEELEDVRPATALRLGRTEDVVRLARTAGSFRRG